MCRLAFPDRQYKFRKVEPTIVMLTSAIEKLIASEETLSTNFLFIVDGLDEYERDSIGKSQLAKPMLDLTKSHRVFKLGQVANQDRADAGQKGIASRAHNRDDGTKCPGGQWGRRVGSEGIRLSWVWHLSEVRFRNTRESASMNKPQVWTAVPLTRLVKYPFLLLPERT